MPDIGGGDTVLHGVSLCAAAPIPDYSFWSYLVSIAPPVTGVIVGAILAFLYTFYFNVRTAQNDVLKDFHADLDKVEELSAAYWLGDHSSTDPEKKRVLDNYGHQLRAKLFAMVSYQEAAEALFGKDKSKRFNKLDTKLLIAATGGEFQTSKVKCSPETYNNILDIASEMRKLIRERRGRSF